MCILFEYLRALCISIFRPHVKIVPFSRVGTCTRFEGDNRIGRNTILANSSVGRYSYMGNNCVFTNTIIGRYCSIASSVEMITGTHPSSVFTSTHPVFFAIHTPIGHGYVDCQKFNEHRLTRQGRSLEIGNDVWIGAHTKILEGTVIGDGAIIAAGSLVTKDVEPYSIVGGIPAKFIRNRFDEDETKELLEIRWWEWSPQRIKKNAFLFDNVKKFIEEYE